jgi:ParB family chromosome partitioning protein
MAARKPKAKVKRAAEVVEDDADDAISALRAELAEMKASVGLLTSVHGVVALQRSASARKRKTDKSVVAMIPLDLIDIVDVNPRQDVGDTGELQKTLKGEGFLENLVVRPGEPGRFELICGMRRYQAARELGWVDPPNVREAPCLVRADLVGDDDRASLVGVAENSEDARSALNAVEIGTLAARLQKRGWSVEKIAAGAAVHTSKIRRALKVVALPDDLQARVRDGRIAQGAAVELAGMAAERRDEVLRRFKGSGSDLTEQSVRDARADLEQEERANRVARGESPIRKTRTGRPSLRDAPNWRTPAVKTLAARRLCRLLESTPESERAYDSYFELRGKVVAALWDRGDWPTLDAPPIDPDDAEDPGRARSELEVFTALVRAHAECYDAAKDPTHPAIPLSSADHMTPQQVDESEEVERRTKKPRRRTKTAAV